MLHQALLWDAKDAAAFFKVSRQTIYRQVEAGKLPHIKVFGTLLRFDPEAMKALAASKTTKAA